jgi:protein-disulfide isomerase
LALEFHKSYTESQTQEEANFIESALSPAPGARIVDVPCGNGRLSLALAARGYDMVATLKLNFSLTVLDLGVPPAWQVLFLGLAFVIGAWCKLCLVADPAAIGYALAILAGATTLRFTIARGLAAIPAVLATVGVLALWTHRGPPPAAPDGTPAFVEQAQVPVTPAFVEQAQVPGTATIVEVVDFECPFCRRMQDRLVAAIAQVRTPVHVVRKMLPLESHAHAMPAALAYCCADAQGKGDAMAAALFAARPDDLSPEGCEKLAASVGCDLDRYRRELPRAEARVAADAAEVRAAGVRALPTLFIGGERVVGAGKSTEELSALLEHAVAAR